MNLRVPRFLPPTLLLLVGAAVATAQMPSLQIAIPQLPRLAVGEPAPPLSGATWVKGSPLSPLGNGKVTVIEFFASWCPTCRETFGHFGELARQYQGKANFAGVSVWENDADVKSGAYVANVRTFAANMGNTMPYPVAVDDQRATLAANWLGATSYDIPRAFIVNRNGQIAWAGHPLADLDDALAAVVSGRFNMAQAVQDCNQELVAVRELISLVTPIQTAIQKADFKNAVSAIDFAVRKKPTLEPALATNKFLLLLQFNESEAFNYARELAAGPCKDSPEALNTVAWAIVDDSSHLKNPDYATAISIAKQAFDLSKQADACIADTLAYAMFKNGNRGQALELEVKAVRLAEKTTGMDPKTLAEIRGRLALFRKSAGPP